MDSASEDCDDDALPCLRPALMAPEPTAKTTLKTSHRLMALATLASALLAPELALAAPVGLGGVDGGWVATAPGPNQTGNGNINTAGLAFEAANSGWNSSNGDNDAGWVNYTPDAYGNSGNGWLPVSGSVSPFCLRREFTLGTPTPGSFGVEFDDDVQVWVNGALVIDDHNGV